MSTTSHNIIDRLTAKIERRGREIAEEKRKAALPRDGLTAAVEPAPPKAPDDEPEFDPERCTCSSPPHRAPCSYCESGYRE